MADVFRKPKFRPNFPPPPPQGHHCKPNINININNDDSNDSEISPVIADLISRISIMEKEMEDLNKGDGSAGASIELGEELGTAYPGDKGKVNADNIVILSSKVDENKNNIAMLSSYIINNENENENSEISTSQIFYLSNDEDYPSSPSISGLYIKGLESKFWNGEWNDVTLSAVIDISELSTNKEIPTAKAVYNKILTLSTSFESSLKEQITSYISTDEEIEEVINNEVKEVVETNISSTIEETIYGDTNQYNDLLSSITDLSNSII